MQARPLHEFEIKLAVPRTARDAVRRAFFATRVAPASIRLQARYFDTADRSLASAGMALRVRREGRRWVQTLKTTRAGEVGRSEFSVTRPDGTPDLGALAGTPAAAVLGIGVATPAVDSTRPLEIRFETSIRRQVRRLRGRGGTVELALDEGRILCGERVLPVCELEVELVSGSVQAVFDVARRWLLRFGLRLDPFSKAERGDLLADGAIGPAPARAGPVDLPKASGVVDAYLPCARPCVDQVLRNAAAIAAGEGGDEHVHQLRVGIRRLRSAWRLFDGWVAPPNGELVDRARQLFGSLGADRDLAVIAADVEPRIRAAGMPEALFADAAARRPADSASAADTVSGPGAQAWLLALLESVECAAAAAPPDRGDVTDRPEAAVDAPLRPLAARRLQRWHDRLVEPADRFDRLDVQSRHALRRRAKRLRYAAEFCASLWERKAVKRYLKRLAAVQEVFGEMNDLYMARARYDAVAAQSPAALFACGWIAARLEAVEASASAALAGLRATRVPW